MDVKDVMKGVMQSNATPQSEVDEVREENMRLREALGWVANECGYASGTENIRKVALAALAKEGE